MATPSHHPKDVVMFPPAADGDSQEWERWLKAENKKDARIRNKRRSLLKKIHENPRVFFSLGLPDGFGDDETIAAYSVLRNRWEEAVQMAFEAEKKRFIDEGYSPQQADSLVQIGWAWKHQKTLLAVRDKSRLMHAIPKERLLKVVMVHAGYRWEPAATLRALAEIELGIPTPCQVGNVSGSYLENRKAAILQTRAFGDFVAAQHAEEGLKLEGELLCGACDTLLAILEGKKSSSVVDVVASAMNVAYQNANLRLAVESELLDANKRQHAFYTNIKPDPSGVRAAVKTALLAVYDRVQRMPRKDEVLKELAPIPSDDGDIHLLQEVVSHEKFDKMLEGIRKTERWRWQKGPEVQRGRPRKKS
ncbi:MAG: hypothetical protein U1F71_03430 [Verrucomicrobiaceae bacterium]